MRNTFYLEYMLMSEEELDPSVRLLERGRERRLPILLRRAWFNMNRAFRHRIAHIGITPAQFTILHWLTEGEACGMTQRDLAELMASDPNTITSLLVRMQAAGLLERSPHESDGRARRIRILPGGHSAYQQGRAIALGLQQDVLSAGPVADRDAFLANLHLVAGACRKAIENR